MCIYIGVLWLLTGTNNNTLVIRHSHVKVTSNVTQKQLLGKGVKTPILQLPINYFEQHNNKRELVLSKKKQVEMRKMHIAFITQEN